MDDGNACVQFSPSEYESIYFSRLRTCDTHTIGEANDLDPIYLLRNRTLNWQIQCGKEKNGTIVIRKNYCPHAATSKVN